MTAFPTITEWDRRSQAVCAVSSGYLSEPSERKDPSEEGSDDDCHRVVGSTVLGMLTSARARNVGITYVCPWSRCRHCIKSKLCAIYEIGKATVLSSSLKVLHGPLVLFGGRP
jgi:hypothetical protein